jgi:excisionase family DNA binding protein
MADSTDGPAAFISLQEAADRLGVHYMTAYRYVRTGRLPARRAGAQWQVDPSDLPAVTSSAGTPGRLRAARRPPPRRESSRRLLDRLVAGDEAGAWAVVEAALSGGATPEEVVVEIVGSALALVGEGWESGELSVDDEHRAAGVVMRVIGRLGPLFSRRGPKKGTVILGTPSGERHGLPTALATNVLRGRGYEVVDLGADVPVDAFVTAVAKAENPLAAAIGVTAGNHDRTVRAIVRAMHDQAPSVAVLVGGAGVADEGHASRLGAGWSGTDATALAAAVDALQRERR